MVTFGPDSGAYYIDQAFEPTHPMPDGVSIDAMADKLVWGNGDHRSTAVDRPLDANGQKTARDAVEELLRYVRDDASRRHAGSGYVPPNAPKGSITVTLESKAYGGSSIRSVTLPPPGKAYDTMAENTIRSAARKLIDELQERLRFTARSRRGNWP